MNKLTEIIKYAVSVLFSCLTIGIVISPACIAAEYPVMSLIVFLLAFSGLGPLGKRQHQNISARTRLKFSGLLKCSLKNFLRQ
jgi:hypothetical protein